MTRTAFILSLAVAVVIVVAVILLWLFLRSTGVIAELDGTVGDFVGGSSSTFSLSSLFSLTRVLGFALMLSAVEIVLLTALATLFAVLYNLAVGMAGGIEVTLVEDTRSATEASGAAPRRTGPAGPGPVATEAPDRP